MGMHSCYRTSTLDSRYNHTEYMKYVKFVCFPKPYKQWKIRRYSPIREKELNEKRKRWIHACGQPTSGLHALTMKNITRETYMYNTFCNIALCNADCYIFFSQ